MFKVTLSEEQLNNLFYCIDATMKKEGLQSLQMVTDLHNVLASATKTMPQEEPEEVAQKIENEEEN